MPNIRGVLCVLVCAAVLLGLIGCSGCGEPASPVTTGPREGGEKPPVEPDPIDPVAQAKEDLDNTEWQIRITSSGGGEAEDDVLTFAGGKISSKKFLEEGFPASNYTLRIDPGGAVIWETMQTKDNGDVLNWRGDRRGEKMRGIIFKKTETGKANFSFISTGSGKIEEKSPEGERDE